MWRLERSAWLGLLTLALGCASRPRVEPSLREVVGPDGSRMLHTQCGSDEGRCYELLGQRCPHGYDLYPTAARVPERYLVRCRAPGYALPAPAWTRPPPPAGGWAPVPAPEDPWRKRRSPDGGVEPDFGY